MKRFAAVFALLLVSCEPFPGENEMLGDARYSFEGWRGLVIDGKMTECVHMMTESYKSQWIFDLLTKGSHNALTWRSRMTGRERTDLDLWFPEAGKDSSAGRVATLPPTVLAEPTLDPLLVSYLVAEKSEIGSQFRRLTVKLVSPDENGVSIQVVNHLGDPEMYEMVIENGMWKVNGHLLKSKR